MKRLISIVFALFFSNLCLAATETVSFNTATNQTVKLGDHISQLVERTAQSPDSIKSTTWQDGANTTFAMQYKYRIGEYIYWITVVNEQVRKIEYQKSI